MILKCGTKYCSVIFPPFQTVTYTADHYNGYIADVAYKGEAKYAPAPRPYKPSPPSYGKHSSFF